MVFVNLDCFNLSFFSLARKQDNQSSMECSPTALLASLKTLKCISKPSSGTRHSLRNSLLFNHRNWGLNLVLVWLIYSKKSQCTFQRFNNFGGGPCSNEHFWLTEYSQHFITPTMFKSLQLQAHSLTLSSHLIYYCASPVVLIQWIHLQSDTTWTTSMLTG